MDNGLFQFKIVVGIRSARMAEIAEMVTVYVLMATLVTFVVVS